ncbi:hypothetical protein E8E13_000354 [Curvularia kusanoi]|uniref:Uncharacterized protein n=1 Tax=Curvularia kusanoi TaxID=90978 RepID=A0A9P4T3A0_CURKU|nr:hypothetical protein E8E13_000354 [Curvularia kusanoi]
MSVFTNGEGLSAGPVVNPGFDNWSSLGCYAHSLGKRTLEFPTNVEGTNTVGRCAAACEQARYSYAGVDAPTAALAYNSVFNSNSTGLCSEPNATNVYHLGNDPVQACNVIPSSISSATAPTTTSIVASSATAATLCPESHNKISTDATGQRFTVYCDSDYEGGNIEVGNLASFELCL